MQGVKAKVNESFVPVAVGCALEASYYVVDALHHAAGDRGLEVVEDLPGVPE